MQLDPSLVTYALAPAREDYFLTCNRVPLNVESKRERERERGGLAQMQHELAMIRVKRRKDLDVYKGYA